jgi:hypothetical protein
MAGNFAPPQVVTIGGKRVKFKMIDQGVKLSLENMLVGRARQQVMDDKEREEVDEDTFRIMYQGFNESKTAGVYSWGGKVSMQFLRSVEGVFWLAKKVTNLSDKELGVMIRNKVHADQLFKLVGEIVNDSFIPGSDEKKVGI